MGGEALKLKLDLPRPKLWDLIAAAVAVSGVMLAGANIQGGGAPGRTGFFAFAQLAVCLGSLMVLGKTAKQGTIWGNLAAVAGMFVGMSGVLLAAALWAAG